MGLNDAFPRKGTTQTMKIRIQQPPGDGVALNSASHPGSDGPEEWELVYAVAGAAAEWAEARRAAITQLAATPVNVGLNGRLLDRLSAAEIQLSRAVEALRTARERGV